MLCPKCNSKTRVINSRVNEKDHRVMRDRCCINQACLNRCHTIEYVILTTVPAHSNRRVVPAMVRRGKMVNTEGPVLEEAEVKVLSPAKSGRGKPRNRVDSVKAAVAAASKTLVKKGPATSSTYTPDPSMLSTPTGVTEALIRTINENASHDPDIGRVIEAAIIEDVVKTRNDLVSKEAAKFIEVATPQETRLINGIPARFADRKRPAIATNRYMFPRKG